MEFPYSSMRTGPRSSLNREWKQIRLEWRIEGPEWTFSTSLDGNTHRRAHCAFLL